MQCQCYALQTTLRPCDTSQNRTLPLPYRTSPYHASPSPYNTGLSPCRTVRSDASLHLCVTLLCRTSPYRAFAVLDSAALRSAFALQDITKLCLYEVFQVLLGFIDFWVVFCIISCLFLLLCCPYAINDTDDRK